MKVYAVFHVREIEMVTVESLCGVFSTEAKADAFVRRRSTGDLGTRGSLNVEDYDVDELDERGTDG